MARSAAACLSMTASNRHPVAKSITSKKPRGRSLDSYPVEQHTVHEVKANHSYLPSPRSSDHDTRKRKRVGQDERGSAKGERDTKKSRSDSVHRLGDDRERRLNYNSVVSSWLDSVSDGDSDPGYTTMDERQSSRSSVKRAFSESSSNKRSSSSGRSSYWWSRTHAEDMRQGGIILDEKESATITDACEQLCAQILDWEEPLPSEWCFERNNCLKILDRVSCRNEQRVERDIPPLISPSPETLFDKGRSELEHIAEAVNADWGKCTLLHGPKPRPDGTYGVSRSALTGEELKQLDSRTVASCEGLVFPFYVRQAKSFEGSMEKAELQALHNTSVAVNTMVQLYQSISSADELHRRVLAFSNSHNHHMVRIFAHFAMVNGSKITFHRRLLFQTDLSSLSSDWSRPYKITLGIFKLFYPKHLERIRIALARYQARSIESFAAQLDVDGDVIDEAELPSSQEGSQAKKASLSSNVRLREQNEKLRDELIRLTRDHLEASKQQKQEFRQQRALLEDQLEQQREESRQQKEASSKLLHKLDAQFAQQREDALKQQEESRKQQVKLEARLQAQQEELMSLLRQSMSSSEA